MQVTFEALMKDLRAGKFHPVYFLEGEEPYFIDKAAEYIEENALEPAQRDFNQSILYGKDVEIVDVLNAAQRYPMFSDRQLVIVREAQQMFSNLKDKDQEMMLAYLEKPAPATVLVFCHKYKSLDKRKALGKVIKDRSVYLDSPKMKDYQLPEWIASMAKSNGFGIEMKTALLLSEYLGNDLSRIANEFEKLHLLLPPGSSVTPEVVEEHIGISKEYNAFELSDALLKKDFHKCMRIVQYFDHNPGAGPLPLVMGSLYNQFSKLYVLTHFPSASDGEIASKVGMPPFAVKDLRTATRHYPLSKVERALSLLSEYDLRYKGVNNKGTDGSALMQEMVYKIIFN